MRSIVITGFSESHSFHSTVIYWLFTVMAGSHFINSHTILAQYIILSVFFIFSLQSLYIDQNTQ